jgi:hypothetical protein
MEEQDGHDLVGRDTAVEYDEEKVGFGEERRAAAQGRGAGSRRRCRGGWRMMKRAVRLGLSTTVRASLAATERATEDAML